MKRIPLSESVAIAVTERLEQGWVGAWADESWPPSGRGYHDFRGHGVGVVCGQGYGGGGGVGAPTEAVDAHYRKL